jgi:DNA-binding transcriptional regulator YhcF (GntR family)
MNKVSKKINELIDKLRGDILCGYLKSGDRLPTIRQLMDDFNLSQGSVSRSINILCEQGLVYKKAGSGVYVNDLQHSISQSNDYHITVFASQSSNDFRTEGTMLAHIYLGIADVAECKITLINTKQLIIPRAELEKANKESDAIIFLGEYDSEETGLDLQVPAVGVFMNNTYNGKLSLLDIDPFDAAKRAVTYFQQYGIEQVHIISSMLPIFYARAKTFETYWRQKNKSTLFSPNDAVIDFQEGHGYFFSSDTVCQAHCKEFFHKTGKKLHEFAHIFSIDGKRYLPKYSDDFYKFPSYGVDWKQIGKQAYEECIYRIKNIGTPSRTILVTGHLKTL